MGASLQGCSPDIDKPAQTEQLQKQTSQATFTAKAGYVRDRVCSRCHAAQFRKWRNSHHDLAMDIAYKDTVKGDFNDSVFTHQGITSKFYKKNKKFFARTDGPDGKLHDYEISYVFGVEPLQQYMIKFPDGRMQILDIAWNNHPGNMGGQKWIHLHPDEKITSAHSFHWTKRFFNWNYMCAECHSTNIRKNYDLLGDTFSTTWSDIDVGCQACHGPGSNHIEWAGSADRNTKHSYNQTGLTINLSAISSRVQIEGCARCHSLRNGLQEEYTFSKPFMDHYVPQVLTEPFYYPDGQIRDEVYVYGSFLQSKKYQKGVRCTDCHDPHSADLKSPGNDLCIECHASSPEREITGVQQLDYDSPMHHFHKEGSKGAQCVECHMPETTYMIVDPRRDHKFQIPRPDLTLKLDIPNPCNRCHKDKTAQWAATQMNVWYPYAKSRSEDNVTETFAAAQKGNPGVRADLFKIITDDNRPAIIRATALNILSRFRGKASIDITALSLNAEDPLVRYEAVKGLSILIPKDADPEGLEKKYSLLVPLLKDEIRAVRTEVARALTEIPREFFSESVFSTFKIALDQYIESQETIADRPEAHLNLGILHENLGQLESAEVSYKTAIRLANDYTPAYFNLANLYNSEDRSKDAEHTYGAILEFEPDNGEAHYSLGLLYSETKRLSEAVASLKRATELQPDRARIRYNYALALRHTGRNTEALSEMLLAHKTDTTDPGIVQAVVIFYMQEKKWLPARPYAEKLITLAPEADGPKQLLRKINAQLAAEN